MNVSLRASFHQTPGDLSCVFQDVGNIRFGVDSVQSRSDDELVDEPFVIPLIKVMYLESGLRLEVPPPAEQFTVNESLTLEPD